jgi:nucleoside-diphosphate-sugar epimerase
MLGRAVALALAARGDDVTVLQRRPSGLPVREVLADVGDPDAPLDAALGGQDAVVHLAAKVDVVGPWREYARTNVDGTRRLLAAARGARVARFVHVSSPSVAHAGEALIGSGAGRRTPAEPAATTPGKALAEQAVLRSDDARHEAPATPEFTNPPGTTAQLAERKRATRREVVVVRPHLVWGPGTPLVGRILARPGPGARRRRHWYRPDRHHVRRRRRRRSPRRPRPGAGPPPAGAGRLRRQPRHVAELLASICRR